MCSLALLSGKAYILQILFKSECLCRSRKTRNVCLVSFKNNYMSWRRKVNIYTSKTWIHCNFMTFLPFLLQIIIGKASAHLNENLLTPSWWVLTACGRRVWGPQVLFLFDLVWLIVFTWLKVLCVFRDCDAFSKWWEDFFFVFVN